MNKFLFILLSSLFVSNIFAGNKDELHYHTMRPAVFAATRLGQISVAHNGKDFSVIKDGKAHPVKPYLVDKTLRGRSTDQVARYLAHHAIEIKEGSDNEFSLEAHNRQLGGGLLGTWIGAAVGKVGTDVVCHGTIWGVSALSNLVIPGSQPVVQGTLTYFLAGPIQALSIKMGIAGGIIGGVGSGPI